MAIFHCYVSSYMTNDPSSRPSRPLVDASIRISIGCQLDALHRQPCALVEEQEVFASRQAARSGEDAVVTWKVLKTLEKTGENEIQPSKTGGSNANRFS